MIAILLRNSIRKTEVQTAKGDMMYEHISGYIFLDERHIIIHNKSHFYNFTFSMLQKLCRQAFPDMFQTQGWSQGRQFNIRVETHPENAPSWFSLTIRNADKKHDWVKFPYVGLESEGGRIKLIQLLS